MNIRIKSIISLATLAVLGLSVFSDAYAGLERDKRTTSKRIQTCISEIGRHADYGDASRVVHWVASLKQRNLAELKIKIETSVYTRGDDVVARGYTVSCVTGIMGDLVNFRIETLAPGEEKG